jgi:DNA-binding CsgD family transcriptional regulator
VVLLLERVNMTVQEREVVERSELAGERMCDIAESFSLSIDSVSYIKRNAMRKIGTYIAEKLM